MTVRTPANPLESLAFFPYNFPYIGGVNHIPYREKNLINFGRSKDRRKKGSTLIAIDLPDIMEFVRMP
jgi:hypothetical protein